MNRRRRALTVGVIAVSVAGLGVGVLLAVSTSSPSQGKTGPMNAASYSYYRSVMGRFSGSSMMGQPSTSMMSEAEYGWMTGGTSAPGWMRGGSLPSYMMGNSTDPGEVMGALFANAPGPRVSSAEASRLGNATPAGATVDTADRRITFSGSTVRLVVLASPSGGPDETFRIAGMVNPTIFVQTGARVSIEVVNADPHTAQGLVVTAGGSTRSAAPMMTSSTAFSGAAVWFLGNATSAGMHDGTLSFTATARGTYRYLCAVPGHAQDGMVGTLTVTS
jgi:rusticyanin